MRRNEFRFMTVRGTTSRYENNIQVPEISGDLIVPTESFLYTGWFNEAPGLRGIGSSREEPAPSA
jgi:hypothetical protein